MSNLAKCQFTITLCLQSKNLQRPETYYDFIQAFWFWWFIYCNKKGKYNHIYIKSVLICSDYKDFKICLGFRIHMLWIYSQNLRSLHTAVAIQAAEPPTDLVKPSVKGRAPFILPRDGQLSTACQHQTWWWFIRVSPCKADCLGKQGTENRLSNCLVEKKALACNS